MSILNDIDKLLRKTEKINIIRKQKQEDSRKRGERFNVFNTLGVQSNEVRLHSALLAELLNPNGDHGMGSEFLTSFQEAIGLPVDFIDPVKVNEQEMIERVIGPKADTTGGRIDIIIEDGHNALIIENKIYAGDQENQLLRYYNYAMEKFGKGHFLLIYLTLDGHEPSDFSTNNQEIEYKCLSYGDDIINWLQTCVRRAYNRPLIRETITQYINLLKQLTGRDMDKEQVNEITKLALDNLEAASTLMEVKDDVAKSLINTFLVPSLEAFAQKEGLEFEHNEDNSQFNFKKAGWKAMIRVCSDKRKWRYMYVGITFQTSLQPISNLTSLSSKANNWWPYGWQMLPFDDLSSPHFFMDLKNGKVAKWIEDKVHEVVDEVETKGIKL